MPGVARLNDMCSGHGDFPPRPAVGAAASVFANGLGLVRLSDPFAVHCDSESCHASALATASATVFAEGLPVGRLGDAIACGGVVATASKNVCADDQA